MPDGERARALVKTAGPTPMGPTALGLIVDEPTPRDRELRARDMTPAKLWRNQGSNEHWGNVTSKGYHSSMGEDAAVTGGSLPDGTVLPHLDEQVRVVPPQPLDASWEGRSGAANDGGGVAKSLVTLRGLKSVGVREPIGHQAFLPDVNSPGIWWRDPTARGSGTEGCRPLTRVGSSTATVSAPSTGPRSLGGGLVLIRARRSTPKNRPG